jgi:[NiFe] hydrogenase diaphorase moiety large subunit
VPCAGAFMVFDDTRDILAVVDNFARFFAHESCGFCTPCRVGTTLAAQMPCTASSAATARAAISRT